MATYVPLHPLPLQFQHVVTSLNLLGGSIEFYLAGTSTPTNLFSDSIGTSIGTSITLNAGGMPESGGNVITLWRDDSIALKLLLKNAVGGTISSADNLPAPRTLSGVPFYDITPAEISAGVTPVSFQYESGPEIEMERYGAATGSGNAAANDAAVVSALAVLAAVALKGGVLRWPKGDFYFDDQITLVFLAGITLRGAGGVSGGGPPGTQFFYTGTAARFIDMRGALGCFVEDIDLQFTNSGFSSGYLLDAGNDGSHDAFRCGIRRCNVGASVGTGCGHLNLDKSIEFVASECHFRYGNPSVQGLSGAGSYSNVISFRDCTWTSSRGVPVIRPGETWLFDTCTFEPLLDGSAGAIDSGATTTAGKGLCLLNCWLGDVTAGGGTWIYYSGSGLQIVGGRITGGSQASTYALSLESVNGFMLLGVAEFTGFTAVVNFADANCTAGVIQGVKHSSNTAFFNGGANAPGDIDFAIGPNSPNIDLPSGTRYQVLTGAGAVDITHTTTRLVTTGANALTLADGTFENQRKLIIMDTDGGAGTLTPDSPGNFSTLTFDDVGDIAQLVWNAGFWYYTSATATVA